MPAEVLARRREFDRTMRCLYCPFVWFEGFDVRTGRTTRIPAGRIDDKTSPSGFDPVPADYSIRQR
jgi:hypothetical protein